jgi:hypothetical protein
MITAAAVMVASIAWWPMPKVSGPGPFVPTLVDQRARLLNEAGDVLTVAWAPPEDARFAGVSGDVVWSNAKQTGFLRLRGMPANNPSEKQYQLWIVDPARDKEPVDGGVFDVAAGQAEIVIPIDPKLAVRGPAAFAITLEQPGGVVVSEGPLLVVAPVKG